MNIKVDPIDLHIQSIDKSIEALQELKTALLKMQRRNKLNEDQVELLAIIKDNPGIERSAILKQVKLSPTDYINKMTSLRRRNMIINLGSRREPKWYII